MSSPSASPPQQQRPPATAAAEPVRPDPACGEGRQASAGRIVVIDEEPLAAAEMAELLQGFGHTGVSVLQVGRGETPLAALRSERPDLLVVELCAGNASALELLEALQADRVLREVPVIATQAEDTPADRLRALRCGVVDVLVKPLDAAEFTLRLRNALRRKCQRDALAFTDACTGLPNREWSLRRLDEALKQSRRYGTQGAVLHVGLDRFRQLSDALGLTLADELLREVGQRLGACVRETDLVSHEDATSPGAEVARGDGDEFTILLPQLDRAEHASVVAQRIAEALREPLVVAGHEVYVSCRIGIAVFPGDGQDKDSVLERAILAMRHGRDAPAPGSAHPVRFWSQALNGRFNSRLMVERELHRALERNELQLLYQPQVGIADGRLCGAEALVRWQHPTRGRLGPAAFIEVAEESGLIVPLGQWVLGEAVRQMADWRRRGLPALPVAVNVSAAQLRRPGLADRVRAVLRECGLDGRQLGLELTESAIIDSGPEVVETLTAIKALGVRLALDDFGTGYSSLSLLRRFPLDELKIDRSFVAECAGRSEGADRAGRIEAAGNAAVITRAIIAMAHGLGLTAVAEGVETEPQLQVLRALRCDRYQGFLYSRPVSAAEIEALLSAAPPTAQAAAPAAGKAAAPG